MDLNSSNGGNSAGSGAVINSINPFALVGSSANMLTSFLPQQTEFSGSAGTVSAGIDGAWDGTSSALMGFPPVGTAIGGVMKALKFLGRAVNALGGGTDGETTLDAILGSPIFNLTLGLVNGLGGSKADSFTEDTELMSQMSSNYGGSADLIHTAALKAGKKYGLFSSGARLRTNQLIRESSNLLGILKGIQEESNELNLRAMSMTQQANEAYINKMQGGYLLGLIRAAKQGAALFNKDIVNRAKDFVKNNNTPVAIKGWPDEYTSNKEFIEFLKSCPEEFHTFKDGDELIYTFWESLGLPQSYNEVKDFVIPIFSIDSNGKHQINPDYVNLIDNHDDYPEFSIGSDDEMTLYFKEGGQLNVIPEGALHAEKHNLENIDESLKGNITHKGIPVVSIDEEGNVEQLAEVERNELILNLETTEAIEKCRKEFHDTDSTTKKKDIAEEAGRIFAKSVIENTDDRTNLMEEI